jgi:acetyl-CoA carboxylase carboxyltransferase component
MDENLLNALRERRAHATAPGSKSALEKLRAKGKLSVRERLDILFDEGSFIETGALARSASPDLSGRTPADGVVTGHGRINGRVVYVAADDATVLGGTRGQVGEVKIVKVRSAALAHGKPFVALMEAGAARVQESSGSLAAGMGTRFGDHFRLSGRVPQVAVVMGHCFGGPSFTAAQSDFTVIVRGTGFMGMSGPLLVKAGIGQEMSAEEMGGSQMCVVETGQADYLAENDAQALQKVREYLSFFPDNSATSPAPTSVREAPIERAGGHEALRALIPDENRRAYDMNKVLAMLTDGGDFFGYRSAYGANLITGWARMGGHTVGIVASNPAVRAGVLDDKATLKSRKFMDLCDAFHIPLVFLCDCPGFLVGVDMERERMVSQAARLINSVYGASVPKLVVVLRKAIGLSYLAMGGGKMGASLLVAWPMACFDVMGSEAAIELAHGREIAQASDPIAKRKEILDQTRVASSAWRAAELGLIDDVIDPAETRHLIVETLDRIGPPAMPGFKHRIDP